MYFQHATFKLQKIKYTFLTMKIAYFKYYDYITFIYFFNKRHF